VDIWLLRLRVRLALEPGEALEVMEEGVVIVMDSKKTVALVPRHKRSRALLPGMEGETVASPGSAGTAFVVDPAQGNVTLQLQPVK
jgi:hypothetical protein